MLGTSPWLTEPGICSGGGEGRGRGFIRTLAFDASFKLPEWLNIRAVTIFVSIFLSISSLWIRPLPWQVLKDLCAICAGFEERKFKLMCIEFSSSWSFQFLTFLKTYTNNSRLNKNKQQPRTVWCLIFYPCVQTVHIGFRTRNTKIPLWIMLVFLAWWIRARNKIVSLAGCNHLYIKIVVLGLLYAPKLINVNRRRNLIIMTW